MATDGAEAFLRAEEEAHRLVDELERLKDEIESYQKAGQALDEAAAGVSRLATRLADIAGNLGGVVETLWSIGTPELLRAQKAVTDEVAGLRQDISGTQRSITEAVGQAMQQMRIAAEELQRLQRAIGALATADSVTAMRRAIGALATADSVTAMRRAIGALATADSVTAMRQALEQQGNVHQQDLEAVKKNLGAQMAAVKTTTVSLLLLGLLLLGFLALSLARG